MSITFPDNDNRARREGELAGDINTDLTLCGEYSTDIDNRIKALTQTSQQLLESLKLPNANKVVTISLHQQTFDIASLVSSAFVAKFAYKGLSMVAAQLLLNRTAAAGLDGAAADLGEIGAEAVEPEIAAAAEELALSTSTKVICGAGGIIVAAGIGMAVDAIDGAIVRDKLRDKIHEFVPIRQQTRLNEIKMRTLKEDVAALMDSFQTLIEAKIDLTQAQIDTVVTTNTAKFEVELSAITAGSAATELASLDADRGSWTNEDS